MALHSRYRAGCAGPSLHPSERRAARRERANLRVQLLDTRMTVRTLRNIMAVILQAINCFFWLAIFNARRPLNLNLNLNLNLPVAWHTAKRMCKAACVSNLLSEWYSTPTA